MEELTRELIAMTDEDLRLQPGALGTDPAARLAHRRVTVRNAELLDEHGWPGPALVGPEAARRAFLIAQHADQQLDLQRRALALMRSTPGTDPAHLAMLQDRVLVNEGRDQRYGTQIAGVDNGTPIPWPCEDPTGLDARRARVGLAPFEEHVRLHRPG